MPILPPPLLEALSSLAPLRGTGWTVSPLAGGITNENYLIRLKDPAGLERVGDPAAGEDAFVLRVAGAGTERLGIDRLREYECAVAAAECGAACEVVARLPEHRSLVVRYAPGKALAPGDLEDEGLLARAVAALRRFHHGRAVPGKFCALETVANYLRLAIDGGVRLPRELPYLTQRLGESKEAFAPTPWRPCHNDLLPANLIDDGTRVLLIDWEYAAMGDPWFDLGNLAENNCLSERAEWRLLELYAGGACEGDVRRLRQMRFASALREAAWGFAQATLSTLDFGFARYAEKHLERAKALSQGAGNI